MNDSEPPDTGRQIKFRINEMLIIRIKLEESKLQKRFHWSQKTYTRRSRKTNHE